jgi:IS30 family transposase
MATEKMNVNERFKYLRIMQERYVNATRKGKSALLSEMQMTTGLHRKHLTARMNSPDLRRHRRNRERSRTYGADVEYVVRMAADVQDWIGADRLQPALIETALNLENYRHVVLDSKIMAQLGTISVSTLRRMLKRIGRPAKGLPKVRRGRRADSVAQSQVPVSIIAWQQSEPGHFEMDLVHHTSDEQAGRFVCSVHFVDVKTGWSELIAILGFTFDQVWRALGVFRERCPIPVREIHTDNGPEFMNNAFVSQFGSAVFHNQLSRGRPGYKNDNRFVEQKNSSLVRAYVGRLTLNTPEQRDLLNALYADMWCYYNLFQPVVRQVSRRVAKGHDGLCRIVRTQDRAATPLDRLLRAKPPISRQKAEALVALRRGTDLFELNRRIHRQIGELAQLAQQEERSETISFQ